jgi:hypothetical protein
MAMLRLSRRRVFLGALLAAAIGLALFWASRRRPVAPTQVFEGVTYGCERLEAIDGEGLVHWVRVDLTAPGIELYVTPVNPEAAAHGWQYQLRLTGTVVRQEDLAVAINGTYFEADSAWLPLPGDYAESGQMTVADHEVGRGADMARLLWFEDDLTPHIETALRTADSVLPKARWAISGQPVWLTGGKVLEDTPRKPADSRTAVGIDQEHKRLYLAVFENASPRQALEKIAELGAVDGMLLDGGDSTSMALGNAARGVRPGTLLGGWRPVATHFGVRARSLKPN